MAVLDGVEEDWSTVWIVIGGNTAGLQSTPNLICGCPVLFFTGFPVECR